MCDLATLTIPTSTIIHRKEFHYACRYLNESLGSWFDRLKTLAEPCLFGDYLEVFLFNKFVIDLEKHGIFSRVVEVNQKYWTIECFEGELSINRLKEESEIEDGWLCQASPIDTPDEAFSCKFNDEEQIQAVDNMRKDARKKPNLNKVSAMRQSSHKSAPQDSCIRKNLPNKKPHSDDSRTSDRKIKVKRKRDFRGEYYCEQCPGKLFIYKCKSNSKDCYLYLITKKYFLSFFSFIFRKGGLLRHMETAHIRNCSSVCHLCGKSFMVACYLTKHLKTHSDEKPFKCDLCPQAFARKDKMKRHRNTHIGLRKHVCQECGKSYYHRYDLTIHMRTHVRFEAPMIHSSE